MRMNTTIQKQKIDVKITFRQDYDITQIDLDEWVSYRQKYIDRGFSEAQAKYFNRTWEQDINNVLNEDWIGLFVKAEIQILMPCGHYEEFSTGVGGYWFDWRKDDLNNVGKEEFENYFKFDLIADMERKNIDISNIEFNLVVDTEIKY